MTTRRPRPCLGCGRLTRNASRCDTCQSAYQRQRDAARGTASRRGYTSQWRKVSQAAIAAHRAELGDWCPGYNVPGHSASDLTADHHIPKARGGTDAQENVTVLCRGCNSRKKDNMPGPYII